MRNFGDLASSYLSEQRYLTIYIAIINVKNNIFVTENIIQKRLEFLEHFHDLLSNFFENDHRHIFLPTKNIVWTSNRILSI